MNPRQRCPLAAGQTEGRWLRVVVNTTPETGDTAQSREGWDRGRCAKNQ